MDCTRSRELLSAALDGEATALEVEASAIHLAACVGCTAWRDSVAVLARAIRLAPADPVPDLTAAILSASPLAR